MAKIWTKQHKGILDDLKLNGRYIVKKEYVVNKMEDHSQLYLDAYNWYTSRAERIVPKPDDVNYPIWVSLEADHAIGISDGNVILEIDIDDSQLITMDIDKWGLIVNNMYIPKDRNDEEIHEKLLKSYGIDDYKAYSTSYYPNVRSKIIKSWDRLFDESILLSTFRIGTIWEIKEEWIVKITE